MRRRKNNYKIETGDWYDEEEALTAFQDQDRFPTSSRHSCKKHISKYHQRKSNKSVYPKSMRTHFDINVILKIIHFNPFKTDRRSSLERQTSMYRPTYYEEYYDNGDQFEPYDNKRWVLCSSNGSSIVLIVSITNFFCLFNQFLDIF